MAGSGDDIGSLSQGRDTFLGGSGSDLIAPGPGADEIEGMAGDDDVARSGDGDKIEGGSGSDELRAGTGTTEFAATAVTTSSPVAGESIAATAVRAATAADLRAERIGPTGGRTRVCTRSGRPRTADSSWR